MRSRKSIAARGRAGQIGRLLCGAQLSKRSSRGEKGRKRKGTSRPKSPSPWVLDGFAKGVLVFRGLSGGKGKDKRRRPNRKRVEASPRWTCRGFQGNGFGRRASKLANRGPGDWAAVGSSPRARVQCNLATQPCASRSRWAVGPPLKRTPDRFLVSPRCRRVRLRPSIIIAMASRGEVIIST